MDSAAFGRAISFYQGSGNTRKVFLYVGVVAAVLTGWMIARFGILMPTALIAFPLVVGFVAAVFWRPAIAIITLVLYGFFLILLIREIPGPPWVYGLEGLLVLAWVGVIFKRSGTYNWSLLGNDLCLLTLVWFLLNILEAFNPTGASMLGWLNEMRFTALHWALCVPLCFLVFNRNRDLNLFFYLMIGCSLVATIYGLKQLHIGLTAAEQKYLDDGAAQFHVLFGKLRVFSFYSDAGQFGASQAHVGLVCLVLAFGSFKLWKRILLMLAAGILLYGMLISGTRGALFALLPGLFVALFLSRQVKIILLGTAMALSGLFVLKYTSLGHQNYNIQRLRTALDPTDASLNVRFRNQATIADYLKDRPFGGGLGVIGYNGTKYNADKFLSSIPPDSYWVKVWAMYGIVGFVIWMGIMMYILGKCSGIIWRLQNPVLKQKLIALTSGAAGVFLCSYGNEVMNTMPSAILLYVSWVFVYLGPKLDHPSKLSPSL